MENKRKGAKGKAWPQTDVRVLPFVYYTHAGLLSSRPGAEGERQRNGKQGWVRTNLEKCLSDCSPQIWQHGSKEQEFMPMYSADYVQN